MKPLLTAVLTLTLVGCAPPYVWGTEQRVKQNLLHKVPIGSSIKQLQIAANEYRWKIDYRNTRSSPAGAKTRFDIIGNECRSHGGPVVPAKIARYSAPFDTAVVSLWLFDPRQRLADVCVSKQIDAL